MTSIINDAVKIRTHSPLKPFQAWIPINPDQTIHSLKLAIIQLLQPSNPIFPLEPNHIVLELDVIARHNHTLCWSVDPKLIESKSAPSLLNNSPESNRKRSRSLAESKFETHASISPSSTEQSDEEFSSRSAHIIIQEMLEPENKPQLRGPKVSQPKPALNSNQPSIPRAVCKPPAPFGQGKASTKAKNKRRKLKRIQARDQIQSEAACMVRDDSIRAPNHACPVSNHPSLDFPQATDCIIHQKNLHGSNHYDPTNPSDTATASYIDKSPHLEFPTASSETPESISARTNSLLDTLSTYISIIR